ncbi:MAG: hypothetical protein HGB08_02395 [Candidatus Moranbacteria bacterium]|nr:hypothetical protein [Candidatus Moranbacteria bacterium]
MFLKLAILISSITFLLGLEFIVIKHEYVFAVILFLIFFAFQEGRKLGKKLRFSILPVLFVISSAALLYLVGLPYEQQIFIFLTTFMYYMMLLGIYRLERYEGDQTARGMNMAATSTVIFFTYAGFYGIYLNFMVPLYLLMLSYLVVTSLVTYQHFSIIKSEDKRLVFAYSFLLGLLMAEMIWTMNFWPFGYLTTGVIALILYYMLWDTVQSYFLNLLSRKRVVANAIFFSFLILLVLLTSKWTPVI